MRVCVALPTRDFDPTEAAVPFEVLYDAGHEVCFATADGRGAAADDRMLTGRGLGPLRPLLIASRAAREAYRRMAQSPAFNDPIPFVAITEARFDALILPGGHAPGMRPYLESSVLQRAVVEHCRRGLVLGAICHGVLVAARSVDPATQQSVLFGRRTTTLLASQELSAWLLTCGWLGNYYRTYPETVEHEVCRALASPDHFIRGPLPIARDTAIDQRPGFAVQDASYVSARWPGDAYTFAHRLMSML